ncbi:hypothetical protein WR164_07190 [Philodulcilactobacillus myokoensis]|uniref:Small secreted protein n=1 Tax=Philodulcilactobacillus myokoensis TaxID=2929573 RepID=A0A9W6B1E9_9LACO|nr:hypothetical protein [Philodulcilactobacillus myokoensis]GLB46740.1 hypothetical protein WR164_07190 [Philodulcilactobacillus myokoensis]
MKKHQLEALIVGLSIISIITSVNVNMIIKKHHDQIENQIIKTIKSKFRNKAIYGTWIHYYKKQKAFIGGINIQSGHEINQFKFIANNNGKITQFFRLK